MSWTPEDPISKILVQIMPYKTEVNSITMYTNEQAFGIILYARCVDKLIKPKDNYM